MKNLLKSMFIVFVLLAMPLSAQAATFEGGPTDWPGYMADDASFLVDYKILNLEEGTEYYVKGRLEDGSGKYVGQIYNMNSNKWLRQTDAWTSFPKITADNGATSGSMIMKLPQAVPGDYWLQFVIRKAGSSVTDIVQGRVSIQALDISGSGNGGYVYGIVPGDESGNLIVESVAGNGINSRYLSEDNGIVDGYDPAPGFFKLAIPVAADQKIVVKDKLGNVIACSDNFNIMAGEIREIELIQISALDISVIRPHHNQVFDGIGGNTFETQFLITGGSPQYVVYGNITNLTTGQEDNFLKISNGVIENKEFNLQADGHYKLKLTANDSLGQSITKDVFFAVDSLAPSGKAKLPLYTNNALISVEVEHFDSLSGVEAIKLGVGEDVAWQEPKNTYELLLPDFDGEYTVDYAIKDKAGNISAYTYTITLDRVAPKKPEIIGNIKFVNRSTARLFHAQAKCEAFSMNYITAKDINGKKVSVTAMANEDGMARKKLDLSGLADGPIEITIISVDAAGNTSETTAYQLMKDTTIPGLAMLDIAIKRNNKPVIVTLTFKIYDNSPRVHANIQTLKANNRIAKRYVYVFRTNSVTEKNIAIGNTVTGLRFTIQDPAGNKFNRRINLQKYR